jgi:hypothetical protein
MAQLVKLKRTSVEGRKPTTSNLELGELAINTYDGKIYFEKDNGTPSIKEIATEDTYHFYTTSLDSRYVNLTGNETIAGNKTFSNNITIVGNLSVEGTTTTIDSTTVNIGDNILELNYGGSQTTGGILIKDATGSSTVSGSLLWDSTNDYWKVGKLGSESEVITTSNIVTNLPSGTVSGSSQISLSGFNTSQLSENTNLYYTDARVKSKLNTEAVLSGSILSGMTVSGSFSGSFVGDGSGLTNVSSSIAEVATVSDTFTNATSKVVTHNFNTKNVIVTVYGDDDSYFIPNSIVTTNVNTVTVTFASAESGRVVVAKGGHIVQGVAADDSNLLDGQNAAYYLNYNNHTNTPTTITTSQANAITANTSKVGYTDALVKTKLNADGVHSGSTITESSDFTIDAGGDIIFDADGTDIILKDGGTSFGRFKRDSSDFIIKSETNNKDIVFRGQDGGSTINALTLDMSEAGTAIFNNNIQAVGNISGSSFNGTGLISGSAQITNLTTHKETVSGASSYAVDHNLGEQYPIVQCWNTSTSQQEFPQSITTNSVNRVTVVFNHNFAGIIIVKK